MGGAEGVPEDDVRVLYATIPGRPCGQAVAAWIEVWMVAGGGQFAFLVAGYPEVVAGESGAGSDLGVGVCQQCRGGAWIEAVGDGLAEAVGAVCRDHLPRAGAGGVGVAAGIAFRREQAVCGAEVRTVRVFWALLYRFHVHFVHAGGVTVEIEIKAEAEQVLVDGRCEVGRDQGGVLRAFLAIVHRRNADDAGELGLHLDGAVEIQIPVEAVFVVADSVEGTDHEPPGAAHLGGLAVAVVVLPEDAVVLLVDAYCALDGTGAAVRLHRHVVEVVDFAEAVAAEHEGVGAIADAGFAGVEHVLPAVHGIGVAVGHHHVRESRAVQHRTPGRVIALARAIPHFQLVQHEPVDGMHGDAEAPVGPGDGAAFYREAGAVWLADFEGFERRAQVGLACGVVATMFRWQRYGAVVFEVGDSTGGKVDMSDETLHGAGVAVVGLVLAHEADGTVGSMAGRDARMLIAAGRPRIDLHMLEVGYAAFAHGGLPAGVFLRDAHGAHHIGKANGRLALGNAGDFGGAGGKVNDGIEAAVGVAFRIVEAHEAQAAGAGQFASCGECLEGILRRFDEGDRTERRVVAELGLD